MQIINCEQGSVDWHTARCGVITASCFSDILTKGRGGEPSKTRQTYMFKLAGERIRGVATDSFSNGYIERGHEYEDEARQLYELQTGYEVAECGFIKSEYGGYSPDGIVDNNGIIEIKTKSAHLQIEILLSGKVPAIHTAQIQGGLLVSGRNWCDFISYCPGLPIFIERVLPDAEYINNLKLELAIFENELQEITQEILSKF